MKLSLLSILCFISFSVHSQTLHSKAFGNAKNKPVIFIHGGPGSNSATFEATTAQKLADKGFYVIFYDRRGEGRSADPSAKFTFDQTFEDLNSIYKKYHLKKANIIGFSFGGIVTTLYATRYPEKVNSITLVSSLLSLQETYRTILDSSKKISVAKKDNDQIKLIAQIEQMDRESYEFRYNCFKLASRNGFFNTPNPNQKAKELYASLKTDTLITKLPVDTANKASIGFWKNERYSSLSILPYLKKLKAKNIKIFALYGKDDGMYSNEQIETIKKLTGANHFGYLADCAHYLYVDQQAEFLDAMFRWKNF